MYHNPAWWLFRIDVDLSGRASSSFFLDFLLFYSKPSASACVVVARFGIGDEVIAWDWDSFARKWRMNVRIEGWKWESKRVNLRVLEELIVCSEEWMGVCEEWNGFWEFVKSESWEFFEEWKWVMKIAGKLFI